MKKIPHFFQAEPFFTAVRRILLLKCEVWRDRRAGELALVIRGKIRRTLNVPACPGPRWFNLHFRVAVTPDQTQPEDLLSSHIQIAQFFLTNILAGLLPIPSEN